MAITKRWIYGPEASDEEWSRIDEILATRGWSSLNRETSFFEIAEDEQGIVGFIVAQMHPMIGPEYVRPSSRGTGLAGELADDMVAKLQELEARGWLVIADSPFTAKKCREIGMEELSSPVFRTN